MTRVARNEPCPCQSGVKTKKCHPEAVGLGRDEAFVLLSYRVFLEAQPGYVPPPSGDDGWSVRNFQETGCPFGDVCNHNTDLGGRCASPTCGV